MAEAFGDRSKCIVLTGSHARGEALPSSDIDLWVFLDEVQFFDLTTIGNIVERVGPGREINPQCTSFSEVNSGIFRDQFSPVQLHMDGVILQGQLDLPKPSPTDLLNQAGTIAACVMLSARHYITAQEPEEHLAKGKLQKWLLKPLMWALRYEIGWRVGRYPRSFAHIMQHAFSPEAIRLVQVYQQLLEQTFSGPWIPEVKRAESVARLVMSIAEKHNKSTEPTLPGKRENVYG